MRQTIGDFLLRRLEVVGIRHLFGVPGDYNLEFMQQIEDRGRAEWIGNCNEFNASYAADGYARLNGLSALVVTNGVGALSAANGIAGAFSEHVPVICICGSLPLKPIARNRMMHHTASEIDRCILAAWRAKRPVYIELPSDIAYLEIVVPEGALRLTEPETTRNDWVLALPPS